MTDSVASLPEPVEARLIRLETALTALGIRLVALEKAKADAEASMQKAMATLPKAMRGPLEKFFK